MDNRTDKKTGRIFGSGSKRGGKKGSGNSRNLELIADPDAQVIEDIKSSVSTVRTAVIRDGKKRAQARIGSKNGYGPPPEMPFESTLAFAFRTCGGKETAINAARLIDDDRYRRLVFAYDTASKQDKDLMVLEDLCQISEIPPDEFVGSIIQALWKRNVDIAKLTAVVNHPRIVEATIAAAQSVYGNADRKMLLDHMGFLPKQGGMSINVGVDNSSKTIVSVEDTSRTSLPTFEAEVVEIASTLRENMLLEAPAEIIDVEEKDVPSDENSG